MSFSCNFDETFLEGVELGGFSFAELNKAQVIHYRGTPITDLIEILSHEIYLCGQMLKQPSALILSVFPLSVFRKVMKKIF